MNTTTVALLVTAAVNLALGLLVYLMNSQRAVNQLFFVLALVMATWTACVLRITESVTALQAEWWIRVAFIVVIFIPGSFSALHLAVTYPDNSMRQIYRRFPWFWLLTFAVGLFCFTRFFMRGAYLPAPGVPGSVPEADYGPGFAVFAVWFLSACVVAGRRFVADLMRARGVKRAELQFILLGFVSCVLIGTVTSFLIPLFSSTTSTSQFGPLSSIALMLIIAYGIAKYHIMDVTQMLRRATAYALLGLSLVTLYAGVWSGLYYLLGLLGTTSTMVPGVVATLAVALSMAPTHGYMQRFAHHLFISFQEVDIGDTVQETRRILHAIRTLPDLLGRFSDMITQAAGTDRVAILLQEGKEYLQRHPALPGKFPTIRLQADDPLVARLRQTQEPVVAETLHRRRPTPERRVLADKMAGLKASIAIGIRSRNELDGIMLLGPRLTGRIYGNIEQNALQILCDQLAVALENARLYTETQDSKIYNEILLDNLPSGVVAANAQGIITVFNREAQRITGMESARVISHIVDILPGSLAAAIRDAFATGRPIRDRELTVLRGQEAVPIRLGSSVFRGHAGQVLGALLVFSDQTQVRKLEMQVRRTDRLASVGTLSAGMAHEIKNPLVTIKTFSQLLPERYMDEDFRNTFAGLLQREVKRIDAIVNQLLHFARPAKPQLSPAHLHHIIDDALALVEQPLRHRGIRLERSYRADHDMIQADPDLLDQALINFFLNAIEAMEGDGRLIISTELMQPEWAANHAGPNGGHNHHIRISITDTGVGIPAEVMPSIFDPFFTTKSNGTGLGLSVAHGIVHEHGGVIDVESQPATGTTFHVVFPLIDEARPA